MDTKKTIYLIGLLFAMVLSIAHQGWAQRKPETAGATINLVDEHF